MSVNIIAKLLGKEEVLDRAIPLLKELISKSRQDKGCIHYDAYRQYSVITFVEAWQSEEDLSEHQKTTHFLSLVDFIKDNDVGLEVDTVRPI